MTTQPADTGIIFDVMLFQPIRIDFQAFKLWIAGFTVEESVKYRLEDADGEHLFLHYQDQFRAFTILQKLLANPQYFLQQNFFLC